MIPLIQSVNKFYGRKGFTGRPDGSRIQFKGTYARGKIVESHLVSRDKDSPKRYPTHRGSGDEGRLTRGVGRTEVSENK